MRTLVLRASLRPLVGVVSAVLLTLAPTACRREPPAPSAEYEEAARRFRELYAQKLDDAYLDPQVGEIEAQLQRVPADSLDAAGARELLQRIKEGRQRMETAASERDEAVASAQELPPGFASAPSTEAAPPPAAEEAVDAGPRTRGRAVARRQGQRPPSWWRASEGASSGAPPSTCRGVACGRPGSSPTAPPAVWSTPSIRTPSSSSKRGRSSRCYPRVP
ncbi:hypothetical protein ACLEPN_01785 [Myxococcus sp. 1LA]